MTVARNAAASYQLLKAAESLSVDAVTASVTASLKDAGISSVLLKGPAIAEWLYTGRGVRAYTDTDLLVGPEDWESAGAVLRALGFEDDLEPLAHPRMESFTSHPWVRGTDHVDLHCGLWGIGARPDETWRVLSPRTVPMRVGGREVQVLAPGARALHLALHVAQHGPAVLKPLGDLELAIALLPLSMWEEAAVLAAELDAIPAFAAGLEAAEGGQRLSESLGIAGRRSVDALIRAAQVPLAEGFQELATTRGLGARFALLRREVLPNPEFMRWWSPLARRGRLGLVASYVSRVLWLCFRAGPGLVAWRRARRAAL